MREKGILTTEDAIRKATSAVAKQFGIDRRGELREGYYADLVMYDPENIGETNSFAAPHSYPKGIDIVMVNGEIVIENGEHTNNLPGRILRKSNIK